MLHEETARPKDGPTAVTAYEDILAIERTPLADRHVPQTPYAMLERGAVIAPDAPALALFAQASRFKKATTWSHRELFRRINPAGALFRRLGVQRGDAVAFILPNLPETHLAIWGGEAAGIAFAISPLLEREQIANLLEAVEPAVLVTLAPTPGTDTYGRRRPLRLGAEAASRRPLRRHGALPRRAAGARGSPPRTSQAVGAVSSRVRLPA